MHIQGIDYAFVTLNKSEIEKIISVLEIDWHEWNDWCVISSISATRKNFKSKEC